MLLLRSFVLYAKTFAKIIPKMLIQKRLHEVPLTVPIASKHPMALRVENSTEGSRAVLLKMGQNEVELKAVDRKERCGRGRRWPFKNIY